MHQEKYKKQLHHATIEWGWPSPARRWIAILLPANGRMQTSSARKSSGVQIPLPTHFCKNTKSSGSDRDFGWMEYEGQSMRF